MKITKDKARQFLLSFIVTSAAILLVSGLAAVDTGTRGVAGYMDGSSFVFSASNKGLDITAFQKQFNLHLPAFLVSSVNNVKYLFNGFNNTADKLINIYKLFVTLVRLM